MLEAINDRESKSIVQSKESIVQPTPLKKHVKVLWGNVSSWNLYMTIWHMTKETQMIQVFQVVATLYAIDFPPPVISNEKWWWMEIEDANMRCELWLEVVGSTVSQDCRLHCWAFLRLGWYGLAAILNLRTLTSHQNGSSTWNDGHLRFYSNNGLLWNGMRLRYRGEKNLYSSSRGLESPY